MDYIGIDIGSTAAKVAVLGEHNIKFVMPTGWSSKETAEAIRNQLINSGVDMQTCRVVSTGYGRSAVTYAQKKLTEITCHAAGAMQFSKDCTVIDVGGQDTKVICVENGSVFDFLMNDKCSAGTGKFIEVMANRLGYDIDELFEHAALGIPLAISSLCTVFAESEIINYIG
ncbi:(R)-2-hydroxyglutaryl-CoA dehydratase activating ATPase [bioreactor metagenome]|uniref:(R)-2-hydroxyglutaryl-CoA dehydratase activating ATPase n=1 Tax=bioreactor metagenome TaxID=1076179 RepID=A0A645FS66_9ZZZZ